VQAHVSVRHCDSHGKVRHKSSALRRQVLSFLLCGIVLVFLLARGERFRDALGFIVVLLVASIPIAIEIVRRGARAPGPALRTGLVVTRWPSSRSADPRICW